MNRIKEIFIAIFLIALVVVPRSIGLGKFVTVDEPFWLHQGSNFYYALGQRDFEKTVYEYHPAVTTMWIVSAGMAFYFPEYRALDQGYLKPGRFAEFLPAHGKNQLNLLIYSREIQVVVIAVLLMGIYYLLQSLFGGKSALTATLLLSFSPFFLGHSRVLNHEAMMALFNVVSILSLATYLFKTPKFSLLLLSGAAGALSQLTKSTGFLLFPSVGILFLYHLFENRDDVFRPKFVRDLKTLGIWILILIAAYFLFWPGMWVNPGKMLFEVYGNALTYFFVGTRVSTIGFRPEDFHLTQSLKTFPRWISGIAWRTTPLTWMGLLLACIWAVIKAQSPEHILFKRLTVSLFVLALLNVLVFTLAPGLDSPHYAMNAYVAIDILAGLGLVYILDWLSTKYSFPHQAANIVISVIIILQGMSLIGQYPYYYTYYNPIMEAIQPGMQNPTLIYGGYGEGLEQAAAYLAAKPNAKDMTVMSFYGNGPFSFFFPGQTIPINNLMMQDIDKELMEQLQTAEYVVIDYHTQKKENMLYLIEDVKPEKVIWLNGVEYIHIYRTEDLRQRYFATHP